MYLNGRDKDDFTLQDTKAIKAIAIILMLMHHLWGFPDRIADELSIFGIHNTDIIVIMGNFGKVCLSILFIFGGYGLYNTSKIKELNI